MAIHRKLQLAQRRFQFQLLEDRRMLALDTVAGSGVTVQYFGDPDLSQWVATHSETSIDQDWGSAAPLATMNEDAFSARIVGQFEATFTEEHVFHLDAAGGARLWVNGVLLIDHWTDTTVDSNVTLGLVSGRRYDIQLEFRETGGVASVNLRWSSPSMPLQPIPTSRLFATQLGSVGHLTWDAVPGDSIGQLTSLSSYPNQPDGLATLSSLQIATSSLSPKSGLIAGAIHAPVSGNYRFYLTGDGEAELWLSNTADSADKQRIAFNASASLPHEWTKTAAQQSAPVMLVAGQRYAIEVVYRGGVSGERVAVGWRRPGSVTVQAVPPETLSPPTSTVKVFAKHVQAVEGGTTPIEFAVRREGGPTTLPMVVTYSLRGTATPGVDYAGPATGTVTIPALQDSANVSIFPLTDAITEGNEKVVLEIVDQPGYDVGLISERRAQAIITDIADPPAAPLLISPSTPFSSFNTFGGNFTSVSPTAPYSNIVQGEITDQQPNSYNAQIRVDDLTGIQAGDILLADFSIRSIGDIGRVTMVAENGATYENSLFKALDVPMAWTRVQLPFVSVGDYATGGSQLSLAFFLGEKIQTIQIADIHLYHYGPPRDITPTQMNLYGTEFGNSLAVTVDGQPFTTATRIQTVTSPPSGQSYRLQYVGTNSGQVAAGDMQRVEFYARSVGGAAPRIDFAIQTTDDYETFLYETIGLTATWQHFSYEVALTESFTVHGLQAALNVGFDQQTVEIADVRWTNTSRTTNFDDLPSSVSSVTYGGRDGDDAWRTTAADGIEENRQAALTVQVIDAVGDPVDGAVVSIRQTDHAFRFGSAISSFDNLLDPNSTNAQTQKYQSEINRLFNTVVLENSLKWPLFEQDRGRGIAGVSWTDAQDDLYLRGHNVIWPSTRNMPDSVWNQYNAILSTSGSQPAADYLRQTIEDRIRDVATSFTGSIREWDVVNEPFDNNDVMAVLGDDVVVEWFELLGQLDPNVDRVLNDYNIFTRNGNNTDHIANFDSWLTRLNNAGVIERIGEQSHYDESNLTDMTVLASLIDSYHSRFNLPIAITEFDITSQDQQLQADYLRDYMTTTFSNDGVDQFLHWGFWQNRHWRPDAAMYNEDFSIRPHGQVYEDLVFGSWWTDTRGTTRADGRVAADVYQGDYEITVQYRGQTYTQLIDNVQSDTETAITIPITIGPSPISVESVTVSDSTGQRSLVRQIVVELDDLADVSEGAVTIEQVEGTVPVNSNVAVADLLQDGVPYRTEIRLTFSALSDGEYRLTIDSDKVTRRSTTLEIDGDGDGNAGGRFSFGANSADRFYALFGDASGDGAVGLTDFAMFRQTFGASEGELDYLDAFDSDASGVIGLSDFAAFRANFGQQR